MWQSGDIKSNSARLHYTRTGGAKPPLVLVHGVTDDGLCWTPVAQALESAYDVIMADARGHGLSDAPESGYGPIEQAGDLAGVIAALGLQRPRVLGHSMGAVTTLALAGLYPEVPGAIMLEDPPGWWLPASQVEPRVAQGQAGMIAWYAELKSKTREQLIAEQHAASPGWPEAELEPWAEAKLRFSPNALSVFTGNPATSVDWQVILSHIICPALVMTADPARGAILTRDGVAALQRLVPQLRVAHLPGAGHSIRRDQPARYLETISAFMNELTGDS